MNYVQNQISGIGRIVRTDGSRPQVIRIMNGLHKLMFDEDCDEKSTD